MSESTMGKRAFIASALSRGGRPWIDKVALASWDQA